MLSRVVEIAKAACEPHKGVSLVVATDDERIGSHCDAIGVDWVMTPESCRTGSDRAFAAVEQATSKPDFVINLQGDAPFTPVSYLAAMLHAMEQDPTLAVLTPVYRLTWTALDELRVNKKTTPFSGTCAVVGADGRAIWFSKNIIPAIRKESELRGEGTLSPVYKHVGLYGYSRAALAQFVGWSESDYERIEGLEQLRILENGITIQTVEVDGGQFPTLSGIDSPEDVERANQLLAVASAP